MLESILILDCDQSLSGLIARTLRSQNFYCELLPPEATAESLKGRNPKGIVIAAANGGTVCGLNPSLLQAGLPVLALGAGGRDAVRAPGRRCADHGGRRRKRHAGAFRYPAV